MQYPPLVSALVVSALLHGLGALVADAVITPYDPSLLPRESAPGLSVRLPSKTTKPSADGKGNASLAVVAETPAAASPEHSSDLQDRGPLALPVPGDRYYSVLEVDRRIAPLGEIDLDTEQLQRLAPRNGGKIQIRLWIDKSGTVNKAEILKSDMPQPVADQAVSLFAHARFQPAMRQGQPVNAISVIEIDYPDAK